MLWKMEMTLNCRTRTNLMNSWFSFTSFHSPSLSPFNTFTFTPFQKFSSLAYCLAASFYCCHHRYAERERERTVWRDKVSSAWKVPVRARESSSSSLKVCFRKDINCKLKIRQPRERKCQEDEEMKWGWKKKLRDSSGHRKSLIRYRDRIEDGRREEELKMWRGISKNEERKRVMKRERKKVMKKERRDSSSDQMILFALLSFNPK